LTTNRKKAIIFANLFSFSQFLYMATAKLTMGKYEVNGLDLCLVRTFVALVVSLAMVKITGVSLDVP